MINLFHSRVLTERASSASCNRLSGAKSGSVWDEIFKNHMTIEEGCIGREKAKKQMEESNELYTLFFLSKGNEPCSRMFIRDLF